MRSPLGRLFKQDSTRGKSSVTSTFRRLEDRDHAYPLNGVQPGVTTITAGNAAESQSLETGSGSDEESGGNWANAGTKSIQVRTEWQFERHG
jgi:hypothetical protein